MFQLEVERNLAHALRPRPNFCIELNKPQARGLIEPNLLENKKQARTQIFMGFFSLKLGLKVGSKDIFAGSGLSRLNTHS